MIEHSISKKVLNIGCDWSEPLGGVARVQNSYSKYVYNPFNHVISTKNVNLVRKIFVLLCAIFKLIAKCLFCDIEIIHIHGSSYNSFWRKKILINVAKFFNKKIAYHIHGAEFHLFYENNRYSVLKTLQKVDVVIALSEKWKYFFIDKLGCKKVEIVPNITPYVPQINRNTDIDIVYITFVGTICERKGVFDIIDMTIKYKKSLIGKVKINLYGSGAINKASDLIRQNDIADIIECKGTVSFEEICKIHKKSDIYLLPSYNEGLPISILEAMSYSLPIISTNVGGIPEIVKNGENGFLVTPGSEDELYLAIMKLVGDATLRGMMGKKSYELVQPHFPDFVSEKLQIIYGQLL